MGLSSNSTSHSAHYSKKPKMMDLISDELVLKGHSKVYACAWNPSAPILASASGDLRLWNISDGIGKSRPQCDPINVKNVFALEWNVSYPTFDVELKLLATYAGTLLATASHDGRARIWSTSGELKSTISGKMKRISALKWNKNNTCLFTGGYNGNGYVWDVDTSKLKQDFHITMTEDCGVMDVDWRDDDSLATCGPDFAICIYKIGDTDPFAVYHNPYFVNCIRWDPTGLLLASCSDDYTIKIWRLGEDRYIRNFEEHKDEVKLIRWRPTGGGILASASADAAVKLWDVEQGKSLCTLCEHWDSVNNLAFSPNGEYLASGAQDEIHIWSVKEGKLIKSYLSDTVGVIGVCWNNEGNKIAAGFADCSVRVLNFRK